MTRAILLALLLTGCTWPDILPPAPNPAVELVGFDWCTSAQRRQCAWVRQGNDLYVMGHPSRVGVEGAAWDVRAVDALSED